MRPVGHLALFYRNILWNIIFRLFQTIFSYLFYPIAYFIGISLADCPTVGRLLGVKVFINEIFAYNKMSVLMKNEAVYLNYTESYNTSITVEAGEDIFLPLLNQTLVGGIIQVGIPFSSYSKIVDLQLILFLLAHSSAMNIIDMFMERTIFLNRCTVS